MNAEARCPREGAPGFGVFGAGGHTRLECRVPHLASRFCFTVARNAAGIGETNRPVAGLTRLEPAAHPVVTIAETSPTG
jgi:hypothetical protein